MAVPGAMSKAENSVSGTGPNIFPTVKVCPVLGETGEPPSEPTR
ncbi:MAG TPA: hypothetical protein VGV38_01810 [Pyrinomonadaceae bacterium]|nr:hypothetical protein [Pyrinomonadaceae bacterium]